MIQKEDLKFNLSLKRKHNINFVKYYKEVLLNKIFLGLKLTTEELLDFLTQN
eukprot:NODE_2629_length_891_cov_2.011876_g2165_i0.p2 GENE.NODE_2629_length_891_cov_2.011876_g2165_i0~~NODE_2629_length_891_cov_2.011876_g2165_i0.p2  ORF type:complete len:52 (+),score=4.63 NODE_2629_length_891_cov_2.011876_g2165_i0:297-452(+)